MKEDSNKKRFLKYLLFGLIIIISIVVIFLVYSYSQGGKGNYVPPKAEELSSLEQVKSDLVTLSKAIESYYAINLSYPDSLKKLVPDFINELPLEQESKKNYDYKIIVDSVFEIKVSDASFYKLKELKVRNGKIIQY
ncbi:MAG: hypothetical protein FJW56_00725 [Actinobacteria bacterium]|nr:hypothetical protein [Actinomycetota bacterium]